MILISINYTRWLLKMLKNFNPFCLLLHDLNFTKSFILMTKTFSKLNWFSVWVCHSCVLGIYDGQVFKKNSFLLKLKPFFDVRITNNMDTYAAPLNMSAQLKMNFHILAQNICYSET